MCIDFFKENPNCLLCTWLILMILMAIIISTHSLNNDNSLSK